MHSENFDMSDLKLDQLKTFTKVIRHGSFSAAAERLQLSQPAVSLQVRQLEKRLGVRLIERVGKRATPTTAESTVMISVFVCVIHLFVPFHHDAHLSESTSACCKTVCTAASCRSGG